MLGEVDLNFSNTGDSDKYDDEEESWDESQETGTGKQASSWENLAGPIRLSHSLRSPWESVRMGWVSFIMGLGV